MPEPARPWVTRRRPCRCPRPQAPRSPRPATLSLRRFAPTIQPPFPPSFRLARSKGAAPTAAEHGPALVSRSDEGGREGWCPSLALSPHEGTARDVT